MNVVIIIPARGGSKGIPRKNLRALGGRPLLFYSIQNAVNSKFAPDVFVTSEDEEILSTAEKLGARVIKREAALAEDDTTLDPVIYDGYKKAMQQTGKDYDIIVTMQPTSPLLRTSSLDGAIERLIEDPNVDSIISACNDTHLTWGKEGDQFVPNYKKRVNRQYLPPNFKETGGFLITRSTIIKANTRIGEKVDLFLLDDGQEIDIDSYHDWNLCEYIISKKRILFVVTGYKEVGLGHVYNTLSLANEILNHEVLFLVDKKSELAKNKISESNYPVYMQQSEDIFDDIKALAPNVVVNDILDTNENYIKNLKKEGITIVNFEDLGEGARFADLVINAMYPEKEVIPNHYFGHQYFCLKGEFYLTGDKKVTEKVRSVLVTFGGVDPNNYTLKVLNEIYSNCISEGITIKVIAGMGYQHSEELLQKYPKIILLRNISTMSQHILEADIAFTSAGRTTFEVASIGVPTIVLCQNEREHTHFFASQEYGFVNLGLGYQLKEGEIKDVFLDLVNNFEMRKYMSELMHKQDLKGGKKRVLGLILQKVQNQASTLA